MAGRKTLSPEEFSMLEMQLRALAGLAIFLPLELAVAIVDNANSLAPAGLVDPGLQTIKALAAALLPFKREAERLEKEAADGKG